MFTDVLILEILSRLKISWDQPVAVVSDQTGNVELLLGVPDGAEVAFSVMFELYPPTGEIQLHGPLSSLYSSHIPSLVSV